MSIYGEWLTATIAKDGTVSAEVNLGRDYEFVDIILPAIDSATIGLQVAQTTGGTFQALGVPAAVTAATTGSLSTTLKLGGWQFVKVVASAAQSTAAVSIKVRGWRV